MNIINVRCYIERNSYSPFLILPFSTLNQINLTESLTWSSRAIWRKYFTISPTIASRLFLNLSKINSKCRYQFGSARRQSVSEDFP